MKKFLSFLLFALSANVIIAQTTETVSIGASYANEVYYSFDNGSVKTEPRNTWDIAFTTEVYDVSILANNGNEIELYTYPDGDISNWGDNLDISGISSWEQMYNSVESWTGGAFTANSTGHPDYGWGIYNTVTHNITGDSIFIIKLASGDYKKLAIVEKNSVENQWTFKYANTDGTDEQTVNFDADDYSSLNFIHYSIENNAIVEQEADKDTWELLFTRYYDTSIPYMVSGVLSKDYVYVQEIRKTGLEQATCYDYDIELFSDNISTIGSDWKMYYFKGWEVADTVVYFVVDSTSVDKSIWKLYFTDFGGMSNGEYTFIQEKLTGSGIDDVNKAFSTVYPNPATNVVNLIYDIDGKCEVSIYNITGQLVYNEIINNNEYLNKLQINIENLQAGFYNITVRAGKKSSSAKFIKN